MIIVYLSYKRGRLYCNTICPVGTLLALLSKVSFYKLKIDEESCEGCGICAGVCKSECIDKKNKFIDFSRCVTCYNCLDVCPSDSITYRFTSPFNHSRNENIYNSRRDFLSRVFIAAAILPLIVDKKKIVQPGKAIFVKDNCIVETEKTACGACSEHCPTKAVNMVDYKNGLKIPEVTDKYCVGCGACEFACPTKPYKAIYVEGNLIHQVAEIRLIEKIKEKIDLKEEFPF